MTKNEFLNYYANVGAHVDDDAFFEALVAGVWQVDNGATTDGAGDARALGNKARDPVNPALIATVAGVRSQPDGFNWLGGAGGRRDGALPDVDLGLQLVIGNLKKELLRRGPVDGLIALQRRLRAAADTSGGPVGPTGRFLSLSDFTRAIKDLGHALSDSDIRVLFAHFDARGRGLVAGADVVRGLRRPLEVRKNTSRTSHCRLPCRV